MLKTRKESALGNNDVTYPIFEQRNVVSYTKFYHIHLFLHLSASRDDIQCDSNFNMKTSAET